MEHDEEHPPEQRRAPARTGRAARAAGRAVSALVAGLRDGWCGRAVLQPRDHAAYWSGFAVTSRLRGRE